MHLPVAGSRCGSQGVRRGRWGAKGLRLTTSAKVGGRSTGDGRGSGADAGESGTKSTASKWGRPLAEGGGGVPNKNVSSSREWTGRGWWLGGCCGGGGGRSGGSGAGMSGRRPAGQGGGDGHAFLRVLLKLPV
jgi:hypothetical protein